MTMRVDEAGRLGGYDAVELVGPTHGERWR